jgi:PAP2 superfamily protein
VTLTERHAVGTRFHRRLPGARVLRDGTVLYWWVEIIAIAVFYFVYSQIRNANGNDPAAAFANAKDIIHWQHLIGIYHEQTLQSWALHFRPIIVFCNYWYGSMHFIVTGGVMVFLYRKWSDDYPTWRNTLGIATAIALIGFTLYPLMPPRLLPAHYGFDPLTHYTTFWTINGVKSISNQFAAMPSVHCEWALWSACALVPRLKRTWAKWLAAVYPVITVTAIVLTANHYFLDAVAGFAVLGVAAILARAFTRAGRGPAVPKPVPAGTPETVTE